MNKQEVIELLCSKKDKNSETYMIINGIYPFDEVLLGHELCRDFWKDGTCGVDEEDIKNKELIKREEFDRLVAIAYIDKLIEIGITTITENVTTINATIDKTTMLMIEDGSVDNNILDKTGMIEGVDYLIYRQGCNPPQFIKDIKRNHNA